MEKRVLLFRLLFLSGLTGVFATNIKAQQPTIKIDLNMLNRSAEESQYMYPSTEYTPWVVSSKPTIAPWGNTVADTLIKNGITFILRKGPKGVTLSPTYYKAAVELSVKPENLYDSRFTNDGIWVKDGDFAQGSSIDLIIKGLPEGLHNVTTFHNITDSILKVNICPLDIYVNDEFRMSLMPTSRVRKITEVATADVEINAAEGEDVVISMRAQTIGSQPSKTVFLNGIFLNAVNVSKKARAIDPVNGNGHVNVPMRGSYKLKWEPSPTATSHQIYFGTDSAGVAMADTNSGTYYKGSQVKADTTYNVSNLYTMDHFYWRIDEVGQDGIIYKGDVWSFGTNQLAFPGAEGYGRFAKGGRGGKVVHVTNLSDDAANPAPGSLRYAVTKEKGPRTIVFDVGGTIVLSDRLVLSDPYVTIAGQTAPGQGILLRSNPFGIGANDAVIRFVRLRLGAGPTADGMGMNGNHSIMDHCSISWTIDEAFSSRGAKNITLQKTLISEALNNANHKNYPAGTEHGYAATVGGNTASLHHNLLAHCYGRNWSLGGGLDATGAFASSLDITNNVCYNWGGRATDGGAHEVNFVNNYYKPGAGTTQQWVLNAQYENVGTGTQRYYFEGNVMPPYPGKSGALGTGFDETDQEKGRRYSLSNGNPELTYSPWVTEPFFPSYVTTQSAYHAYKIVLSDVGVNQPYFDKHDIRMIDETLTGTYSVVGSKTGKKGFPDTEVEAGGFEYFPNVARLSNWDTDGDGLPDWWENLHGLNPESGQGDFSDANADDDRDGYTNLEDYLQWMAEPHFFAPAGQSIAINLKDLSRGFTNSPSYSISTIINGSASPINDGLIEFTADANKLASFEFTVIDADGHDMTRKVNIVSGVDSTLPVTLMSFETQRKNNKEAVLKWKTVQENSNSHFEILRSDDGETFKNLGVNISSKGIDGNSTKTLSYDYIDNNSNINNTYYQLIQKDLNGQGNYSEIKIIKGIDAEFKVWPVPSKGDIYVSIGAVKEPVILEIYDIMGRKIIDKKVSQNNVERIVIINKGIYMLNIKTTDKKESLFTQKVVIE